MLENITTMYETFSWALALGVAAMYFVTDALYAHYTLSVSEHRPIAAANTGALLHFLIAFGVLSYVENYLYIIPIAIGSWLGTFVLVYREQRKRVVV